MNVKLIVIGTHEYEWSVHIFAHLFAKYWGEDVVIYIGDRVVGDLPDNIEFMQVPCFSEGVWPWDHWLGHGLNSIFAFFERELVCLFLLDHWLNSPVYHPSVESLARFMSANSHVVRGTILAGDAVFGRGHILTEWEGNEIWTVGPDNQHASISGGITFCPSLWNPTRARQIIKPQWTLQECETLGTRRMRDEFPPYISVGIRPAPLHRAHGMHHSQARTVNLLCVREEDRQFVREHIPSDWRSIE